MKCPKCSYENEADALFCNMCHVVLGKETTCVQLARNQDIQDKKNSINSRNVSSNVKTTKNYAYQKWGKISAILFGLFALPITAQAMTSETSLHCLPSSPVSVLKSVRSIL